jgi:hypothetical protein
MAPDVCIRSGYTAPMTDDPEVLALRVEAYTLFLRVHVRMGMATATAAATVTCDFLLRLLAACKNDGIFIGGADCNLVSPPLSGAGLTLFFQETRSCLRKVKFFGFVLNEDQCRALATMSRLDVSL